MDNNYNGFLLVDKPKGLTSRDVVNKVSKVVKSKKVGHNGTLDPNATGLLVLGINNGCKLINLLEGSTKTYKAEVILGIRTDTLDITGTALEQVNVDNVDIQSIKDALESLCGTYEREVPIYSACKVNGKRLYDYARENIEVELPKKTITVYSIDFDGEVEYKNNCAHFNITCSVSAGTYVRNIIEDIGKCLSLPSTMGDLRREKNGNFDIKDAFTLEQIENGDFSVKEVWEAFNFDRIDVDEIMMQKIKNGCQLEMNINTQYALIMYEGSLIGVYKKSSTAPGYISAFKVFISSNS